MFDLNLFVVLHLSLEHAVGHSTCNWWRLALIDAADNLNTPTDQPVKKHIENDGRWDSSVDALSVDYHNVARLIRVVVWLDWCISAWDNIRLHHWASTAPFLCRSVGPILDLKRHFQYHISLLLNINMYLSTRPSLWKSFYRMKRLWVAARTTSSGWNLFNIKIRCMCASLASMPSGENIAAGSRKVCQDASHQVPLRSAEQHPAFAGVIQGKVQFSWVCKKCLRQPFSPQPCFSAWTCLLCQNQHRGL